MLRVATARCRGIAHGVRCLSSSSSTPTSQPTRVEHILRRTRRNLLFPRYRPSNLRASSAMGLEKNTDDEVKVDETSPSPPPSSDALTRLREEVAAIRAAPGGLPTWLEAITDPVPAKWVVRVPPKKKTKEEQVEATNGEEQDSAAAAAAAEDGGVVPNHTPESGPWHVHLRIRGPLGSGYDASPYRVRLTFTPRYPFEPPDVHVLSHCHHALVDGDKEVAGLFYHPDNLPPMRVHDAVDPATGDKVIVKVEYGLRGLLACVHMFFGQPLKIPGPGDDSHLNHHRTHLAAEWAKAKESNAKRERIIAAYVREGAGGGPKDPRLFDDVTGWLPRWMHPDLVAAMKEGEREEVEVEVGGGGEGGEGKRRQMMKKLSVAAAKSLCEEVAPGVYTFPLFSEEYCDALIAEVEHFQRSGLPVQRPNSMNNYGVIVNEIGMERMIDRLQREVLGPVAEALFPSQGGGALDSHHAFIVQYKQGEDLGLDMHTDDSDITFNVCLGKEGFTGAGLSFCGVLGGPAHRKLSLVYKHVIGQCVVHLGAQRHGADDIQSGERLNLIVWNHSTLYRGTDAYKWRDVPAESEPPSVECVSYTHDKDFGEFKAYPPGKERFAKTAWYPPKAEQVKMK